MESEDDMREKILALAAELTGQEPTELLEMLCDAAEAVWQGRLRAGMTAEDCEAAFCCAAAFTAAGDFLLGRGVDGIASFTAGAVSVKAREGSDGAAMAAALYLAAERMMAPYGEPGSFCFRGVQG